MADQELIARLGREFYAAIAGKNPDPLTATFARACAQSLMGACKVMDQKSPVNLPHLMLNGYTVGELAAMCLRTGLVPGGAGDLCGIYIIPQGGQLRFSISPPGYKELAKARGQVITARAVVVGCEPDLCLDGTVSDIRGPHHKPVGKLEDLGGFVVSLNDAHTLQHYASYWVDGATIHAKKADALAKANGRQTPWTAHPMGMASSKALSMVAKMLGLAGERVSYARAEILGAQAAVTHEQAKAMSPEQRKDLDLPQQTKPAETPATDTQSAQGTEAQTTAEAPATTESATPGGRFQDQWAEDCKTWPAFTGMLLKRALEFMTAEDAAYYLPQCIDAGGPDADWTDDTWRNNEPARKAVLAALHKFKVEMSEAAKAR